MTAASAPGWAAGARPLLGLAALAVAVLLPFTDKPFHLDDPLFLWSARQILEHPGDFYGFSVNWYGREMGVAEVAKNPPLAAYYLAGVAAVAGWGERTLHLAFLIPAVAVVLGTYCLARRWCQRPVLATLAGTLTPAFLVSGTNLMSDIPMLACWLWAVVLWRDGLERDRGVSLAGAAALVTLGALTKYYAATLIPLLAIYALLVRRRLGRWALALLVPPTVLGLYQWMTARMYGRGLLADAAVYASRISLSGETPPLAKLLVGLAFTGGCLAAVVLYAPRLWPRRAFAAAAVAGAAIVVALLSMESIAGRQLVEPEGFRWGMALQVALFAVAGAHVLALAVDDVRDRRDAVSVVLVLWVLGTFLFAAFVNWSVNARSVLPVAPAVGILLARRLERREAAPTGAPWWRREWPLVAGATLALLVTWADYRLAHSARTAATVIHQEYSGNPRTLWFQGHWGFQYYMEAAGAKPVDVRSSRLVPDDVLVIPMNNTNTFPLAANVVRPVTVLEFPVAGPLATMSTAVGAAYYSDLWGPLPFAVGAVPPERYLILRVREEFVLR